MISCLKSISRGSNSNHSITTHTAPLLYVDFAFTLLVMAMPCMKKKKSAQRYAYNTLTYVASPSFDCLVYRRTNLICGFFLTSSIFRGLLKPAKYCSHTKIPSHMSRTQAITYTYFMNVIPPGKIILCQIL